MANSGLKYIKCHKLLKVSVLAPSNNITEEPNDEICLHCAVCIAENTRNIPHRAYGSIFVYNYINFSRGWLNLFNAELSSCL